MQNITDEQIIAAALEVLATPKYSAAGGVTSGAVRTLIEKNFGRSVGEPRIEKLLERVWRGVHQGPMGIRLYYPTKSETPAFTVMPQTQVFELNGGDELPEPFGKSFGTYPQIRPGLLVMSDLHSMAYDKAWLETVVETALKNNIKRVLLAGDLFDFTHLAKFTAERYWTTEQEIQCVQQIVAWLLKRFEVVYVIAGNHDARMSNRLDKEVSTEYFLNALLNSSAHPNLTVFWHHHVLVGDTWLVAHPKNYSIKPVSPAEAYVNKYGRSVAIGHTHKWGIAEYNGKWAVEIGIMADPDKFAYTHREVHKHPTMSQGALIIWEDETPWLLHPKLIPSSSF